MFILQWCLTQRTPRTANAAHNELPVRSFHDSYNELRFTQRRPLSFHDRTRASTTASPELPRSLPMYCILPRRHCRQCLSLRLTYARIAAIVLHYELNHAHITAVVLLS